jgi:hypothetical protein
MPSQTISETIQALNSRPRRAPTRRREKVFGPASGAPLDRNAKIRIETYARAWTARHRSPGQHKGPLTRATMEVLRSLLWGFHNSQDGRCFPSYKSIAAKAECCVDTVYQAIRALEGAGVMTWVNRLVRIQTRELDIFGEMAWRSRLIRTSNAYSFRDPEEKAQAHRPRPTESENPHRTPNQESFLLPIDPKNPIEQALERLKTLMAAKESNRR